MAVSLSKYIKVRLGNDRPGQIQIPAKIDKAQTTETKIRLGSSETALENMGRFVLPSPVTIAVTLTLTLFAAPSLSLGIPQTTKVKWRSYLFKLSFVVLYLWMTVFVFFLSFFLSFFFLSLFLSFIFFSFFFLCCQIISFFSLFLFSLF